MNENLDESDLFDSYNQVVSSLPSNISLPPIVLSKKYSNNKLIYTQLFINCLCITGYIISYVIDLNTQTKAATFYGSLILYFLNIIFMIIILFINGSKNKKQTILIRCISTLYKRNNEVSNLLSKEFLNRLWSFIEQPRKKELLIKIIELCSEYRTRVLGAVVEHLNLFLKSYKSQYNPSYRALWIKPTKSPNSDEWGLKFLEFYPEDDEPQSKQANKTFIIENDDKGKKRIGVATKCFINRQVRIADKLEDDKYFVELLVELGLDHRGGSTIGIPVHPINEPRIDFGVLWIDTGIDYHWSSIWPYSDYPDLWQQECGEKNNKLKAGRLRLGRIIHHLLKPLICVILEINIVESFSCSILTGKPSYIETLKYLNKGGDTVGN